MYRLPTFLLMILALSHSPAWADVRLPAIIGSNMVLQQKTNAPIWGWAEPGEEVKVQGSWQSTATSVQADAQGRWQVRLATPKSGDTHTITITGKNKNNLDNVLAGEVWVGSGQSNMQWAVRNSNDSEREIQAADYPEIRLFYVQRKTADTPLTDCEGSWQVCSPATVPDFSAVAYFFARSLHQELGVPLGIINTSWGGTPAEAWTRRQILEADEDFRPIIDRFEAAQGSYADAKRKHEAQLAKWEKSVKEAKEAGKPTPRRPGFRHLGDPGNPHRPGTLYNAMLAPLIPYRIAGVIWYQGESNAGRAYQYRTLFPAMIRNWRADWGQGEFPFYFVQIAPYKGQTPEIRAAQLIAHRNTANTGIVVTMDIGNPDNIHPRNKQDVGKRLALWARSEHYGQEDLVHCGPLYRSFKVEGHRIRIFFDHTGSGLMAKGGALTDFVVAKEGGPFVPAQARIDGDSILVWSDQVSRPAEVRYGWENAAQPNLFNREKLPASPFRTDTRPGTTFGKY